MVSYSIIRYLRYMYTPRYICLVFAHIHLHTQLIGGHLSQRYYYYSYPLPFVTTHIFVLSSHLCLPLPHVAFVLRDVALVYALVLLFTVLFVDFLLLPVHAFAYLLHVWFLPPCWDWI